MSSPQTTTNELSAVAEAIRGNERFVLTTHENPDGDALGSLLSTKLAFDQLHHLLSGDIRLREDAFAVAMAAILAAQASVSV